MKKIRYIIKSTFRLFIIIYINYSTAVPISKQIILNINNINKLNLRLIRISQHLLKFNLKLRHKIDKLNTISNILLRL